MCQDKTYLQMGSLSLRSVTPGHGGCSSQGRGCEGALGALTSVLAPEQAGPDAGEDGRGLPGTGGLSLRKSVPSFHAAQWLSTQAHGGALCLSFSIREKTVL